MRGVCLVLAVWVCAVSDARPQTVTVFKGVPTVKISEGGIEQLPESLPRERADNLACVISKIGDDYYWASIADDLKKEQTWDVPKPTSIRRAHCRLLKEGSKW